LNGWNPKVQAVQAVQEVQNVGKYSMQ